MEAQRANPGLQRLVVIVFLTLVVGSLAVFAVQQWFNEIRHLYGADVERLEGLLATMLSSSIGAVCIFALTLGVNLWRLGCRVTLRRGKVLQVLGIAFILCMLGLLAASLRLQSLIGTGAV